MENIGWVLAALAGLLHVYIFVLEALRFDDPGTRTIFRIDDEHAEAVRPWAWNQGWYNLFLAIGALAGAAYGFADDVSAGPLVTLACGSMTAAALVLVLTDRRMLRSALIQGTIPTLALLALLLG